jgi:hypothetical protein
MVGDAFLAEAPKSYRQVGSERLVKEVGTKSSAPLEGTILTKII